MLNKKSLITIAITSVFLLLFLTLYLWSVLPQPILVFSIPVRLAAFMVAVAAFFYWNDWRALPLALMFLLMALRQLLTLYVRAGVIERTSLTTTISEVPGFIVTFLALISIVYLWNLFSFRERAKEVEAQLLSNKEKFRIMAEFSSDWEAWLLPDGSYEYVSPSCEGVTGYTQAEFIAEPGLLQKITYSDDRERVAEHYRRHLLSGTGTAELEFRITTKSGDVRWIWHKCSPVILKSGEWYGRRISSRDITESKQIEENSKEREAQLSDAQQIAQQGHWKLDLKSNKLEWSKEIFRIFGMDPSHFEPSIERFLEVVHPDDREFVDNAYAESVENRTKYNIEHRIVLKNGTKKWVREICSTKYDANGEPLYSLGTVQDITEKHKVELALKRDREMFMSGPVMTFVRRNQEKLPVERVSGNVENILGYTNREFLEGLVLFADLIHPDDSEMVLNYVTIAAQRKDLSFTHKPYRLISRDEKTVWVQDYTTIIYDSSGKVTHYQGYLVDITKTMQLSDELREAKDAAESANQAKSVFLSNMSHELRTPLNAILGYTQIFAQDLSLTPNQQSAIKTMHQSGEHLLMLINDILDLSKIEARKMELVATKFRLPEFFQEVVNVLKIRTAKKGLQFFYEPENGLPAAIEADELRLRQILLNLLSNAVKFTQNGHCRLRVQSQLVDDNKALLTLTIEDSGIGIDLKLQEKIFEPFQQIGDRLQFFEGSGLGLAISRKLVHLMGGELHLVSPVNERPGGDEGPGSRFFFTIVVPVSGDYIGKEQKKRLVVGYTVHGEESGVKKILIVDDSASNRAVLRDTLETLGFVTGSAEDGSQVLAACKRFQPDAIMMDLRMPEMDGFAATDQLKLHPEFAHIPVIAVTASTTDRKKCRQQCLDNGFSGFINKPYAVVELLETLAGSLHIELLYSDDIPEPVDDSEIIAPSHDILSVLDNLVQTGDVVGITTQATEIALLESGKYHTFAKKIEKLAEEFKLIEIEKIIALYKEV